MIRHLRSHTGEILTSVLCASKKRVTYLHYMVTRGRSTQTPDGLNARFVARRSSQKNQLR